MGLNQHEKRFSFKTTRVGMLALTMLVLMSGSAMADYAPDRTKDKLAITMALTIVLLVAIAIWIWATHKRKTISTRQILAVVLVLVLLLVTQAVVYATHKPWYERKSDEESSKPEFVFYVPDNAPLTYRCHLHFSEVIDVDMIYHDDKAIVVYIQLSNDDLRLLTRVDAGDSWSEPIDIYPLLENVTFRFEDLESMLLISLNVQGGRVVCQFDWPLNETPIQTSTIWLSSIDGMNWSETAVISPYEASLPLASISIPERFRDFGWTYVEDHSIVTSSRSQHILRARYGGHGLDVYFDRGTFFAFSDDGITWSDLVSFPIGPRAGTFLFHELGQDRFCCVNVVLNQRDQHIYMVVFDRDDFFEVDGPFNR